MKTFITTLSILSLATSFSFAQKGKIVKTVLKPGNIRASSAMREIGPKVIKSPYIRELPRVTPTSVSRSAALQRLEQNLEISIAPSQEFIKNAAAAGRNGGNALLLISSARSTSPLKEILNAEEMFFQWYIPEVKKANKLLTRIAVMEENGTLFADAQAMQQLEASVEETVVNHSLKRILRQDIKNKNYSALVRDIADYYTLPRNYAARQELADLAELNAADAFAVSAAGYMTRHPHKINLKWRRLMTHPAVSKETQEALQVFINKNSLSALDVEELQNLLKDAYLQHASALSTLRGSPEIEESVRTYRYYLEELQNFIANNGRLPSWNTLDQAEQTLHQELALLTLRDDHLFEPLKSLSAKIRAIMAQHTPAVIPFEEILPRLQTFCSRHHRLPASYSTNPHASAEEAELHNQFVYWKINGSEEQWKSLQNLSFR